MKEGMGDWKLVAVKGQDWELYNLKNDRCETKNLASNHPEKVKEMSGYWKLMVEDFKKHAPKVQKRKKKK